MIYQLLVYSLQGWKMKPMQRCSSSNRHFGREASRLYSLIQTCICEKFYHPLYMFYQSFKLCLVKVHGPYSHSHTLPHCMMIALFLAECGGVNTAKMATAGASTLSCTTVLHRQQTGFILFIYSACEVFYLIDSDFSHSPFLPLPTRPL